MATFLTSVIGGPARLTASRSANPPADSLQPAADDRPFFVPFFTTDAGVVGCADATAHEARL